MVVYDSEYPCMLCTERFESQLEWTFHLTTVHNVGMAFPASFTTSNSEPSVTDGNGAGVVLPTSHIAQNTECTICNGIGMGTVQPKSLTIQNTESSSSPGSNNMGTVHPTSHKAQNSESEIFYNNDDMSFWSSLDLSTSTQPLECSTTLLNTQSSPVRPPTATADLFTPPRSTGTATPYATPKSVSQAAQNYPTPNSVHTQALSYTSPQRYGANRVYGNQPPQYMSNATSYATPPQSLKRQFISIDTNDPACLSPFTSPTRKAPIKLPPGLPPLPQSIYTLGLTEADFDPTADHGKPFSIASRYIDIHASLGIPDEHMFNAHHSIILAFGNLLRLAAKYPETEFVGKLNAMRKGPASPFKFKSAFVTKRLKSAVKWAAGRPEWAGVGDVGAWLDGQRGVKSPLWHLAGLEGGAVVAAAPLLPAVSALEVGEDVNFDDVFADFLAHPEQFGEAWELAAGEALGEECAGWLEGGC